MSYDDPHHPSPWGPHDWKHGSPHNSWAPFILSMGVAIFLFTLAGAFKWGEFQGWGKVPLIFVGLGVVGFGLLIWWRQDISFGVNGEVFEPKAAGAPFQNIDIRKVAMWVFLMSEMMVFTSLFSTYMRYRFGIASCQTVFESGEWVEGAAVICFEPASHLIASSWFHIAPGAINTFALIISSFTIVQALRYAKMRDIDEDVRRRKITRYLGTTWFLAILFLTMKMIEWFLGFPLPEFLHEFNHGDSTINSLYTEGYLINADHYQHHEYDTHYLESNGHGLDHDSDLYAMMEAGTHPGGHMMANIQVSATTFYVTTGTHGAHVFGGIIGLSYMTLKAARGGYTPDNAVSIEYFGLYWHFVDLVWVLVFPFFYLY
ncbi:MAG: cytochrome c oxidase subunit 3 [Candidatus Poseidoniia archaeon]